MKMKILIVTTHFYPEDFKCNDMAFELVRRGYNVTVLAPIPDYPQGRFYKGYGVFRRRSEIVDGVKVIRTLVSPRRNGSAKWLGLNYLTYTLFASIRGVWEGLRHRYDAVLVHETSPVMVGIPAVIVKKLQNIPLYFWVLDLWPESLAAAGNIKSKIVLGFFGKLTAWLYRNSDRILISSKGFRKSIDKLGNFDKKLEYFPNWIDAVLARETTSELPEFPIGFNVLFAGNIGDAQDMPHVIDVAERLKESGINFILVGDGRKREWVLEQIRERKLCNVFCPGRYPLDSMASFFKKADVLFFALKDDPIFALTVPAKLQAYMFSGKPIVAMINGEGADLIKEAKCGWSVAAEDVKGLAELLRSLAAEDKESLRLRGLNGQSYSLSHFRFEDCIDHLERIIG